MRNAAQAAGPEGRVVVRAADGEIDFLDSGPGLPPGHEDDVFKPFFTTKPTGTGLGLVVSQRIARSFGWRLECVRDGDVTRFRVTTTPAGERGVA
jgi:signal transduction histidine kinase